MHFCVEVVETKAQNFKYPQAFFHKVFFVKIPLQTVHLL